MKFSRSDFEMQRFESHRPQSPTHTELGRARNATKWRRFVTARGEVGDLVPTSFRVDYWVFRGSSFSLT